MINDDGTLMNDLTIDPQYVALTDPCYGVLTHEEFVALKKECGTLR